MTSPSGGPGSAVSRRVEKGRIRPDRPSKSQSQRPAAENEKGPESETARGRIRTQAGGREATKGRNGDTRVAQVRAMACEWHWASLLDKPAAITYVQPARLTIGAKTRPHNIGAQSRPCRGEEGCNTFGGPRKNPRES